MSHNHSIHNLLNIKDQNIIFDENFCTDETVKGIQSKVFHGTLTYQPEACYVCGHAFDAQIIKHGFKTSVIKMPSISGFHTYLKLRKQRYFCKHCHSTFTLKTNVVAKNCCISNNTKVAIALQAKEKISEKDIAKHHNVSHSTVNRIIDSFYEYYKPNYNYLPKHLCFDEFKSVKSAAGAMSFIFCDSETGKIVDIVEDRRLHVLKDYFLRYSKQARHSVQTIVIDMYSPYISLIQDIFPKARIIIDKFHIFQLFSRALNKTRIKVMNQNKKHYNKFKKYWKLLLKDRTKINYTTYQYHRCFKKLMREIDIIDYLLDLDPELKASYELYHTMRYCMKTKDFNLLKKALSNQQKNVSSYMKTAIKTINKYINYIENTFNYDYNNGVLEGINNKIKVIKRIAFGYRCFFHFKNRILITQNLTAIKKA
ncbi:ISL3 family transposase [Calidifontibacillus erzurumensis]|uniref:ISL3 family transposase n=1 Tax=Calidifontibacillus erzurumensis TaxID=2741433 RepID=UPI0035B519B1